MTLTILNKAISDSVIAPWQLKAFTCRFSAVMFYYSMYISIILLGLISLDRYFKVVKPFGRTMCQSMSCMKILTVFIWISLFCTTSVPTMILTSKPGNTSFKDCIALKTNKGIEYHFVVNNIAQTIFWTVCILIVFCYACITKKVLDSYHNSQSSNKIAKSKTKARVFIIIGVFVICFVPYHLTRIPYTNKQVSNTCIKNPMAFAKETTLWLSATNTCLDPLIYVFLCKSFRQKLSEVWKCNMVMAALSSSNNEESSS
ncbi:P2Y13 protein, partial [Amia calva]|nr:P2Y13 protein [Amia calva]